MSVNIFFDGILNENQVTYFDLNHLAVSNKNGDPRRTHLRKKLVL